MKTAIRPMTGGRANRVIIDDLLKDVVDLRARLENIQYFPTPSRSPQAKIVRMVNNMAKKLKDRESGGPEKKSPTKLLAKTSQNKSSRVVDDWYVLMRNNEFNTGSIWSNLIVLRKFIEKFYGKNPENVEIRRIQIVVLETVK